MLESHRSPTVWEGVSAGSNILSHVHRCALIMVTHNIRNVLHADLAAWLDEEWESLGLVVAHCIFDIIVCILSNFIAVFVHESELAVAEDVESSPSASLAASHSAEIEWCIRVAEAEILVLTLEIALFACKADHVRCVHAVLRVIKRESADACLVCV